MQDVQDSQGRTFQVDKLRLLARSLVHEGIKGDVVAIKEINRLEIKPPRGHPTSYKPEFDAQAHKLCQLGATDRELADFFDVSIDTITQWKSVHPRFSASLKVGKDEPDERVVRSLYQRAMGYSFDTEEIFVVGGEVTRVPVRKHVPPDVTACIFWLKNRRQQQWRDVHKLEHGQPGDFDRLTDDELVLEIRRESEAIALLGHGKGTVN
jgi:hypothetical protein